MKDIYFFKISRIPKFKLGQLFAEPSVRKKMEEDSSFKDFVQISLDRYIQCDWGDTCDVDRRSDDIFSRHDVGFILAIYEHKESGTKIWIATEWDRSATVIMFPDEY